MKSNILFKNNVLVKSKNNFKVEENRALQIIFMEVQRSKNNIVYITQNTFRQALKSNNLKTKNGIEKLLLGLVGKHIEIKANSNANWKVLSVISCVYWNEEEQSFTIEVPITLKTLLVNYNKGEYTPINLDNYLALKSLSSQRLYELIRAYTKYNNETVVEYALKEIKELLSLDNSYGLFSNFRKKVIEHAVEEFQANKLFKISKVEYAKAGKNVVSIKFYITDLIPKDYNSKKIDSDGNAPIDGQIDLEELLG